MLALKAARKQSREEEIKAHGKSLRQTNVVQSEKVYNRKKKKAENRNDDLPFFLRLLLMRKSHRA